MRRLKAVAIGSAAVVALTGCGVSPYDVPFPGGADTGDKPMRVTVEFRDVLDLVPQSGVRVNDIAVGKVKEIKLKGWTAVVELEVNRDAKLPANAVASIRQTSLLGEKFVSLDAPETGATGTLKSGDTIPLARSGRNPEIEEVLGAASLLFNGGGLEKTRTVVRELNKTLDGNESEVKELLRTANSFVTQLDDNKEALLTSLEKVNNLAVETNKQKGAITGALDNLPEALATVNEQRDELVKLLEALNRLGDVGTRVVKGSKADTIADLKALTSILRNLAAAGDDLAKSLTTLLTFPFTDGSVGGAEKLQGARDFAYGDYSNLSITLDLSVENLANLLGLTLEGSADVDEKSAAAAEGPDADTVSELSELVGGLVPELGEGLPSLDNLLPGAKPTPKATTTSPPKPGATPTTPGLKLPTFCSLLGQCRVAPTNAGQVIQSDLGRLLIGPVVVS